MNQVVIVGAGQAGCWAAKASALCRALGRTGPGPMALTRMSGANESANVRVRVHSPDLLSV